MNEAGRMKRQLQQSVPCMRAHASVSAASITPELLDGWPLVAQKREALEEPCGGVFARGVCEDPVDLNRSQIAPSSLRKSEQ